MLLKHKDQLLSSCRLILASASPRRAQLLQSLGLFPAILPSDFEEDLDKEAFASAGEYAAETATHKAIDVSSKVMAGPQDEQGRSPVIIAADTIVEIDGVILEKPADEEDARRMLRMLSGREHRVYTGVAIVIPSAMDPTAGRPPFLTSFHECTQVQFGALSPEEISAYVATGEPLDKAGAYGIQGYGACLVKRIDGCFFNVMGLPLHRLASEIDSLISKGIFPSTTSILSS